MILKLSIHTVSINVIILHLKSIVHMKYIAPYNIKASIIIHIR
jgi:hypothetical protein